MSHLDWAKLIIALLLFVIFPVVMWVTWEIGVLRGMDNALRDINDRLERQRREDAKKRHPSN